ncbi:MAG: M20/M25/M40 family metallo-hydrolase [Chloroflexota bacterium]|nr:M20/M25/M40 family metallo-hydrolase [Chloroflexota bacterium]
MDSFTAYVESHKDQFLAELKDFCSQPSIAAQGIGMEEMAALVREQMERLGAEVQLLSVDDGPPVVYAEVGEGERTLLIYNHYDVQPPDPLNEWESPPFEPTMREGKLFARGVSDDKGELMARIQAIEAYQVAFGKLPLRIKFVVEGEEEVGSPHLAEFASTHADLLQADGCLWEGGGRDEAGRPVITLGLKGIQYLELRARGAESDLHSSMATLVPNPAWRLVWALSTLKDEEDHITIDGYMDHVAQPTEEELEMLRAIPFEEEKMRERFGIPEFIRGLTGVEALKKHLYEPTCTICGFRAGYIEEGTKTVLPSEAMVKLDLRLVSDLTPKLALKLLREHLDRRGFTDIEIVPYAGEHPAKSPADALIVQAARSAVEATYDQPPVVYPLMAGSGPMYPLLSACTRSPVPDQVRAGTGAQAGSRALGIPAVTMGVSYPGANIHAPNENIRLEDYWRGIRAIGELIRRFGE